MKIVIIGHGGHSKVIYDSVLSFNENEVIGFLDDKYEEVKLIGQIICGPIKAAEKLFEHFKDIKFVIAVGDNKARELIFKRLNIPNDYYATIIHKSAEVSRSARIGEGTVIMPKSVVNANTEIGHHSIINSGAIIEHDCKIGNFVHVCPNATLTGSVQVDDRAFVGAGATIIPTIKVGEGAVIGAGATVIHNVPSHNKSTGVPARNYSSNLREGQSFAEYNSY